MQKVEEDGGILPVLVAGDPERAHMQKVEEDGGILYHNNVLQAMVMHFTKFALFLFMLYNIYHYG